MPSQLSLETGGSKNSVALAISKLLSEQVAGALGLLFLIGFWAAVFSSLLGGTALSTEEVSALQGFVLLELCKMYHAKGWTQQFHLGALRNNNERAHREIGPDTGYDSIGDFSHAQALSKFHLQPATGAARRAPSRSTRQ